MGPRGDGNGGLRPEAEFTAAVEGGGPRAMSWGDSDD